MIMIQHATARKGLNLRFISPKSDVSAEARCLCVDVRGCQVRGRISVKELQIRTYEGLCNINKVVEYHENISVAT